jgi:hypothetical protein
MASLRVEVTVRNRQRQRLAEGSFPLRAKAGQLFVRTSPSALTIGRAGLVATVRWYLPDLDWEICPRGANWLVGQRVNRNMKIKFTWPGPVFWLHRVPPSQPEAHDIEATTTSVRRHG